jgi:hypothetical protein
VEDATATDACDLKKSRLEDKKQTSSISVMPGVDSCFRGGKKGASRGVKSAGSKVIAPTPKEMNHFKASLAKYDPMLQQHQKLYQYYEEKGRHWLWLLQLNFNLFLYGIGCKKKVVEGFARTWLSGEDVLLLQGDSNFYSGGKLIKTLLNTICTGILKKPEVSGPFSLETMTKLVCGTFQDNALTIYVW